MVWLKEPCDANAWNLPFTRIGWGSLAGLVFTFGGSATRSVFTDGGYSALGFYIFVRGDVGYSLIFGGSAPESSGSIHFSPPVQGECGVVNVALITAGCG